MNSTAEVEESFKRCTITGDIIGRFYGLFIDSHPDIKPRFATTNFDSQKKLLFQSIGLAILHARNNPVGRIGINRLRESHSRSRLDIPPHLYAYWKESFMQAVSELDAEFSDDLRTQWDWVLQKAIDDIVAGHEDR